MGGYEAVHETRQSSDSHPTDKPLIAEELMALFKPLGR
jgi:hypothetical protein